MCSVAGEVGDGIRPHPVCTPSYIAEVMLPAVRRGAAHCRRCAGERRGPDVRRSTSRST